MQLKKRLERIERDIEVVAHECASMKPLQAFEIGILATHICETAAIIAGVSREVQGRKGAKARLRKNVRKALGFYE